MLSLENFQRKTAAEVLINMSGAESLIQDYTSTKSDGGGTRVSTQTDPVTSVDASTRTSTQCVQATMTDMTGSYLEALEQEYLHATYKSIDKQSQWSQSAKHCVIVMSQLCHLNEEYNCTNKQVVLFGHTSLHSGQY